MSTTAKAILIAVIVLAGLRIVVCGGGGVWLYYMAQRGFEEPKDIAIFISAPEQVKRGETFTIDVRIVNQADRQQKLDSIDVYDSYTAGVRLRSSTPAWRSSSHMVDFVTFEYQIAIPPRSEQIVTFEAQALKAGDFAGDFDICINAPWSFLTEVVRTIVVDDDGAKTQPPSAFENGTADRHR